MTDWAGIVNTTIRDYIREVENDVMRNRKLLAMLQARGGVTFNHSGTEMDWKIRYKRAQLRGYADMDTQTFPRRNRHKTAVLGYRGYSLAESISKLDELKNRGTEAIVKIMETKVETMLEDVEESFADELYIDGNAAGNGKRLHGTESFLGSTGTQSSVQPVSFPSSTYAGLSTVLGNYGGSWTKDGSSNVLWPSGKGTTEYDFYSPTLVDYTSAFWGATQKWAQTARKAIHYLIIKSMKSKSERGRMNMVLLEGEMYRILSDLISASERIVVNKGSSDSTSLTGLGYGDVINIEGAEVTWEFGMPDYTGYGFNLAQMELCSMQDRLFVPDGPFKNEESKTTRFAIDFFGNLKHRPRYFGKLYPYTAYSGSPLQ